MFEERVLQVAFVANGIWALRFPSKPTYDQFCASFNAKLFHNMTGLEYSDTNKAKVRPQLEPALQFSHNFLYHISSIFQSSMI